MTVFAQHHPSPVGRSSRQAAADAFFARPATPELLSRVLAEAGTPAVLLEAWQRDCDRARAASAAVTEALAARLGADARARTAERAAAEAEVRERKEAYRQRERERKARWIAANPEKMQKQRRRWREGHRDQVRASGRAYYHRNRDELLAATKRRNQDDPATRAAQQRRYYEKNQEHLTQRQREYRADPEVKERYNAYNKEWRRRERARIAAGLPPRRLHRVTATERRANHDAAEAFFTRPRTPAQRNRTRQEEEPTPLELIAAWERDSARAREAFAYPQRRAELAQRRAREQARQEAHLSAIQAAREAEASRMDEIARAINARLRLPARRRDPHHNDPAAPHTPGVSPRSRGGPSL
ncbi:hypothetical protein [Microbacterium immunditiarum]|uniref:Uncharacterized protein n=1 Tax=Microbacterium immunditiarum TaxID=337480 RepID=A0A7Y9GMJ9_9MICO|nr:hypothetical protein [Microbacterium immunditiarum]NYE18110.1 hypothetical protein [Microbacterium immunditiarum]